MILNLRRTESEESGGTPLVIVHGLFGSGDNWASVARDLPERPIFMPDLINHGASPHDDTFTLESMADDVLETLDDAGLKRFALMGHSLGGKIALLMALQAPARVGGLVVLDIAPKVYEEKHRFIINAMGAVAEANCASRKEADGVMEQYIPERPIRAFLLKNFVPDGDAYRWRINLHALDAGYPEIVSWPSFSPEGGDQSAFQYDGPSLVIAGGQSSYVEEKDEELFRQYTPNVDIQFLPEAGHWVHTDSREKFLSILAPFLSTI